MKSLLLLTTAALLSGSVLAQQPGAVLVYGTIGYQSIRTDNDQAASGIISTSTQRSHQLNTGLGVGRQISPHWTVGLALGFDASKQTSNDTAGGFGTPTTRFTGFSAGPFARYTKRFAGPFFAFGQVEVAYQGGRFTSEYSGTSTRSESYSNGLYSQVYPAFGVQVAKHAALSFNFGGIRYSYSEAEPNNAVSNGTVSTSISAFQATFGSQMNLAVQWYFNDGHHSRGPRRYRRMHGGGVRHEPMSETRRMRDYEDDEDDAVEEAPAPRRRPSRAPMAPRRNRDDD